MRRVPYHIGEGDDHSLAFVARTDDALSNWDAQQTARYRRICINTPTDEKLTLVYTQSKTSRSTECASVDDWPWSAKIIAYAYLTAHTGILENGVAPPNKTFQPSRIQDALNRVQWKEPVPQVAATLWSNLVLAHPLPNANHRTALAVTAMYINAYSDEPDFTLNLSTDDELFRRVDELFQESKRTLTVRRNTRKFELLQSGGVQEIKRKGGVIIPLPEYDLTVRHPYSYYADQHQALASDVIRALLQHQSKQEVLEAQDKGKDAFAQSLKTQ